MYWRGLPPLARRHFDLLHGPRARRTGEGAPGADVVLVHDAIFQGIVASVLMKS